MYCTVLYCTELYCTVTYCTVLYTLLYSNAPKLLLSRSIYVAIHSNNVFLRFITVNYLELRTRGEQRRMWRQMIKFADMQSIKVWIQKLRPPYPLWSVDTQVAGQLFGTPYQRRTEEDVETNDKICWQTDNQSSKVWIQKLRPPYPLWSVDTPVAGQ